MIYSKHRFTLDMQVEHSQISIPVTVGDTGKVFLINLSDGGEPYKIPDGSLAMLTIHRPTGTYLKAFCPIKSNSTIEYDFMQNANTAVVEGVHDCELTLYGAVSGSVVSTAWFTMIVSARVVNSDDLNITDEDRSAIDAMIAAEATRQSAEQARIAAESGRVDAENSRIAAEEERQAYYEDFMNRVDSGEFGGDTSELEQTVARHTEQIEQIDRRVSTLERGGGSGGGGSGGGGDTTELKQRIANAEADIEDLDQRVEVNEENIRDLYNKLPSGGNANFLFADSVEELPDPSTVPEDTVGLVPSSSGGASGGGGGLTAVSLSTVISIADDDKGKDVELTSEESALLSAAAKNNLPFIVTVPIGVAGGAVSYISGVTNCFYSGEGTMQCEVFLAFLGLVIVLTQTTETRWVATPA